METRNPSGWIENAGVLAIFGSLGLWLSGMVDDTNLANAIIVAAPIVGKSILIALNNALGGTLASMLGTGPMQGARLPILAALALGFGLLAAPVPALAQDSDVPLVGCGGGTCSIYFVSASWPPAIGLNAVEFVRGTFGVGLKGVHADGDLTLLGGLCLIPRVSDIPLCPQDE